MYPEESKLASCREQMLIELLLQGCDNEEIAKELHIAKRTVKAHFNRLFMKFGIADGIKRVKLATLLYQKRDHPINLPTPNFLTAKQLKIIHLITDGMKNVEIAREVGGSEHVIKNYLRVIYDELGLWNRVELSLWYECRRPRKEEPHVDTDLSGSSGSAIRDSQIT